MEKLYQDYKGIAEFYIVYISEAHAADDKHPVGYAKELDIKEHKTYGERCTIAGRLLEDKKLTIPCLVDNLDGDVENPKAHPPRRSVIEQQTIMELGNREEPTPVVTNVTVRIIARGADRTPSR